MPSTDEADNSVLRTLFAHNTWANLKLLTFCEALSEEQLNAAAIGTYGTIRETLPHLVGAEVDFVHRVNGQWPPEAWPEDQFPGFALLKQAAQWADDAFSQLALSARADSIVEERWPEHKMMGRYPLAGLLMQAIDHATEHRTHIATILTQLGLEPPDMAGWLYLEETGEFQMIPIEA